ncbi:helix-turn-helix domain-containing protein [Xanthocytophaga flava]|uniref:helix-turn-helix domain-containing protein n=1 Tax=Xanthocytophaga flava TaxID=3048013 RepID=UPI0028D6A140|nr:helix-turn-helix domain-containing protein [Xanthocytophaga flavus]MDJ1470823.1 helix-turn-helix domain-containing protein [Xanthocytophaga flavus]
MKINFTILVVTVLVGMVHGLITTVFLFSSSNNRRANRILGLLVLGFSLQLIDYFLNKSGLYIQHSEYYFLPIYFSLSFGPLIYLYVKTLTVPGTSFRFSVLWHFVPGLLQFVFYTAISVRTGSYKTYFWFNIHQPVTQKIELYASFVSIGWYLLLSLHLLQTYRKRMDTYFSNTRNLTLKWLTNLLLGWLVLYSAWLLEHLCMTTPVGLLEVLMPVCIYWMGWMGYQQKDIIVPPLDDPTEAADTEKVSHDIAPSLVMRIQQAVEGKKLYLNPSLTLADLATEVNLPPRQVSFIINAHFGKSFNSFVNEYRVEVFKSKLISNTENRFTMLGLALDSGFNSQASFYRIFREITGLTPKEYLKKLSESS